MLEVDAFKEIHKAWKRLGFPFDYMVPSYATAIGSSGDNPAALARLMGILANDGVRRPTLRIRSLRFAAGTPFDTIVKPRPAADERLLPSSLVAVVKQELIGVVKEGTARRISGVMAFPDGTPVEVGGKTGTGDNRFTRFAKGGGMIESRVINRTGTFVFMIGKIRSGEKRGLNISVVRYPFGPSVNQPNNSKTSGNLSGNGCGCNPRMRAPTG